MRTRVSSKGQIVLPAEMRRRDGIRTGQAFEIERVDKGEYRLKQASPPSNDGLVDLLLACPAKGCLGPAERAETTDDIPGALLR